MFIMKLSRINNNLDLLLNINIVVRLLNNCCRIVFVKIRVKNIKSVLVYQ